MGVSTASNASPATMAANIKKINTAPTITKVNWSATTYGVKADLTGISGYSNLVLYENIFPVITQWRTADNTGGATSANVTYSNGIVEVKTSNSNAKPNGIGGCYVVTW